MRNLINKKKNIYYVLILLVLGITMGYALLNTTLNINGTTNVSSASWNIYWDNIILGSNNVTDVTTPATIKTGRTEVEFNVNFKEPGDTYEFTVDAVNGGTIDGMISVVSNGVYAVDGTTPRTLPDYLEYEVTYSTGLPIEQYHLLESGKSETYKVRVHYKEDIDASSLPSTADSLLFKFAVTYVQSDNNAISIKTTCEAGQYLPKGENSCSACKSGSYCIGGTYTYSPKKDQGTTKCATGSYSGSGSSACTACSNGRTTSGEGSSSCSTYCENIIGATWATATWNSDNTVSNGCVITSCNTVPNISFELIDNFCEATGKIYSYGTNIKYNQNIKELRYNTSYKYSKSDVTVERGKYMHIETDVESNIIKKANICFSVSHSYSDYYSIYIYDGNVGDYCFESSNGQNIEQTYQHNVAVLKSIFGNNNSHCTETESEYKCINSNNQGYKLIIEKTGNLRFEYDEPDGDSTSYGNPYCAFTEAGTKAFCGDFGCLDGDTEVEVYDKKKKKRYKKKLRDVTPDDLILCWDFDSGQFVFVEPLWIKQVETMSCYYELEFSDNTTLTVIGDHKIYDADRRKFVNAGCDNELEIGSHVFNSKGEVVELISWKKVEEQIDAYNVITDYHMNLFANGILTSCVFSNIYSIEEMKYVMEESERITTAELDEIDEKYVKGLRLNEVPTNFRGDKETTISYIKQYVNNLISKEK